MSEAAVGAAAVYDGIKAGKVTATVQDGNGNALKSSQYKLNVYKGENDTTPCSPGDKLTAGTTVYVEAVAADGKNLETDTKTKRAEFSVGVNIAKAKVKDAQTGKSVTKVYTGQAITFAEGELEVTLKGVTDPLKLGTDYEIVYSDNVNKGTALAFIKGIGVYSGTKTIKFKITAKNIN